MAPTLTRDGEELVLNLSGHPNFQEALSRVKQIPGRRPVSDYKGQGFRWVFPANERMAIRIMHSVQPDPDAEVRGWLREAATKAADELAAKLPDPASVELYWPKGVDLYDFQRPMVEVMAAAERYICADDMGLGKTIESIGAVEEWLERSRAVIRSHANRPQPPELDVTNADEISKPKLVIAATSKLGDWVEELEKWSSSPKVIEVVPGDMAAPKRKRLLDQFARTAAREGGWLVVNHEQIRAVPGNPDAKRWRDKQWVPRQPWFAEQEWLAYIGDESHRFKNDRAQQTRGLWEIQARLRYLLSGNPMINSPDELWAQLAAIRPDLYHEDGGPGRATYWQFYFTYCESYEVAKRGRVVTGVKNEEELRFELSDKYGRRSKRLLRELGLLPERLPTRYRRLPMRPKQAQLYRATEDSFWLTFERDLDDLRAQANDTGAPDNAAHAQAALDSVERAVERGEDPSKVVKFLPNAAARYAALKQIATSPALVDEDLSDESGKLDAIVEEILDHEGKQFVVFGWHQGTVELIAARLNKRRVTAEFMHGDTGYLERTEVVRRFEEGDTQVLCATIKTGGEGLNLVAADTVLYAEQSESVADNDQGVGRIDRLGQTNKTQAVVFLSDDTVETENQAPRLRMKRYILGALGRELEEGEE